MDAATGKRIEGDAHLAQSLRDIVSTPIGTRVGRRDYGCPLFELVDAPLNLATAALARAAIAIGIARWEPRIALTRVQPQLPAGAATATIGQCSIAIEGRRTDVPTPNSLVRLTLPLAGAAAS